MNRYFLIKISIFLVKPLYYLIHYNIFFGLIQKHIFKIFKYKNFKFEINYKRISTSYSSSFLFNTYEYNDRVLVEKYIDHNNKSIIIGGGIGFIACINYRKSLNECLISEIDESITSTLKYNLKNNDCKFKLIEGNLLIKKKQNYDDFFINENFIANSKYINKHKKKVTKKNYQLTDLYNYKNYNTLIIDGEGIEEHFISHLEFVPEIHHIFFELHFDILGKQSVKTLFENLKKNHFILIDNCFNSFYFKKNV